MLLTDKILEYVKAHPGCRQREIAKYCHLWFLSNTFLNAMQRAYKDGLIDCEYFSDPANMEYYNKWYLTDAGRRALIFVE